MKREVLKYIKILKDGGISNPVIELQRFISDSFNIPVYRVIAGDFDFSPKIEKRVMDFCRKRAEGIPYAYIVGFSFFYGRKFLVNRDVLIPRPETEIIVDFVIKRTGKRYNGKLLDCCTGSGIIGITLSLEIEDIEIVASDYSEKAVEIALKNADILNASVDFLLCDKTSCFKENSFDIIVANPPYIGLKEKQLLEREVLHEPEIALFGGEEGYEFIEDFLLQAKSVLRENGLIVFEIGYNQKETVESMVKGIFDSANLYFLKDLNGHYRVGVIDYA